MRGDDPQPAARFSAMAPEERVPPQPPLRALRVLGEVVLTGLSSQVARLYAYTGRPAIAPAKLRRARWRQVLSTVRSERRLRAQRHDNRLWRGCVGLNRDDPIWEPSTCRANRERWLAGEVAHAFFDQVLAQAQERALLSDEQCTVERTLLAAWAGEKRCKPKESAPTA